MNLLRSLGSIKYKLIRVIAYLQLFNAGMLMVIAGWKWWYILLLPIGWLIFHFESKFGIPGELDVAWKSSAAWTNYEKKFDELYKKVMS